MRRRFTTLIAAVCLAAGGCSWLEGPTGGLSAPTTAHELDTESTTTTQATESQYTFTSGETLIECESAGSENSNQGPWVNRLLLAHSADGMTFTHATVLIEHADVPSVAIDEAGTVHIYYSSFCEGTMNQIVHASSPDLVNWTLETVTISGAEDFSPPCDPTIVILDDGSFRLYFTAGEPNAATTANEPRTGTPNTHSAASADGTSFTLEQGVRFGGESGSEHVLDPSVLETESGWILFAGGVVEEEGQPGTGNWFGTSDDGLTFTATEAPDTELILSNGVAVGDGTYRYFAFERGRSDAIWYLTSTDGRSWAEGSVALELDESAGDSNIIKDAAVAQLGDGTWLMVYASEIPGLATASRSGPPPNTSPDTPVSSD